MARHTYVFNTSLLDILQACRMADCSGSGFWPLQYEKFRSPPSERDHSEFTSGDFQMRYRSSPGDLVKREETDPLSLCIGCGVLERMHMGFADGCRFTTLGFLRHSTSMLSRFKLC